ncbi:hypothetical protein FOVG_17641 [Fusarium oxysporum f. sp. pisi HDV247]|uniref:Uncharacterized protein n=1 Tax=Fusarium oxysporum f. sp. pisi HDV247 TaxID=1080344 RepID=W9NTC7_FUSOX|nr:hypothetical protein FOVG_17641 [Fusarium oxysporum f. sp. pisi HDV247]
MQRCLQIPKTSSLECSLETSFKVLSATKLLLPLSAMAETTSNRGGLIAPPNSPTQGATTPPSRDEIQSHSLMDPIPTTRMTGQLEDEPPQSSAFSRIPSPCQPVTLGGNSIALSRANYGRQEDHEIIHASATPSLKDNVSPNNSPPLNHLLIRFNQSALLACGLFNHSTPSNVFALWDVQCLNQYGVEVYTWSLLAYIESSTSKPRKRYDSGAQWLELRLHDLQAHLQLRDYAVLEAEFSDRQTPEGMTTRAMLCQLQRFQEAAPSDFAHWPSEAYDDAVAIFLTKCLARLRFTASLTALEQDPVRVMATIFWKFERNLESYCSFFKISSPSVADQAECFRKDHYTSWLADESDDSGDDDIDWDLLSSGVCGNGSPVLSAAKAPNLSPASVGRWMKMEIW